MFRKDEYREWRWRRLYAIWGMAQRRARKTCEKRSGEKDQETAARKPTREKIQQDERKGVGKDHVDG